MHHNQQSIRGLLDIHNNISEESSIIQNKNFYGQIIINLQPIFVKEFEKKEKTFKKKKDNNLILRGNF